VISADVPIGLERPRTMEMRGSAQFGRQILQIYRVLESGRPALAYD